MNYLGDFSEDATVRVVLTTNNGDGAAVAPSSAFEAADFRVYKNGSATQKATTNGITITSPFDSVTGLHVLEIDTSNDTGDSGFWTTGADYWVVATPDETVDSQTVVAVIATFSIQNRYSSARLAAIEEDTLDIQSRIPPALDNNRMVATVGAYQSGMAPPTAAVIADAVLDEPVADHATTGSLGAAVGAISSALTTLLVRISSSVATMFSDLIQMITGSGTVNAQFTEKALENTPSPSSAGEGARTVLISVTLDGVALEGALVRLSKGAETYIQPTDVDGECIFNIDDGTWTVAITAPNASFEGDELVVNGDETPDPYDMTPVAFLPSDSDKVTGYYTCYSQAGVVESGVTITVICDKPPSTGGLGLDSAVRSGVSGVNGVVQFTNMFPGATYKIKRNAGQNYVVKIPDDATGEVALNSIIGP